MIRYLGLPSIVGREKKASLVSLRTKCEKE